MKKLLFLLLMAFVLQLFADEIPPWIPAKRVVTKVQTAPVPEQKNTVVKTLNGNWKISGLTVADKPFSVLDEDINFASVDFDDSKWDSIKVPLNWYVHYPKKCNVPGNPYVKGWYRKDFELTESDINNKRIMFYFDAIAYDAKIFLNGKEIGGHLGDFTAFEVDGTKAARVGENTLAIRVITDTGKNGGIDKLKRTYGTNWIIKGGIWQGVRLGIEPDIRISSILATPFREEKKVKATYRIINNKSTQTSITLNGAVTSAMLGENYKKIGSTSQTIEINPGLNVGTIDIKLDNPQEWSPESPYLYNLTLDGGECSRTVRFGVRDLKTKNGKFYLNGKEIYMFGQNITSVRYGGFDKTMAEEHSMWENEIKNFIATGSKLIRPAHGPIPFWMLDVADEYGLMMYMEWSWCFIVNLDIPEFEKNNSKELVEFIEQAYNNPCVVMWCGGNEVRHADRPDIRKLLNDQVSLIKKIDISNRPVSVFSGAGGWYNYGEDFLNTDVLDMHNYTGIYDPWTTMPDLFRRQFKGALRIYKEKEQLSRPQIAWENVGYSWGAWNPDLKFKRGNVEQYAEYMSRKTTWAMPNGVGFTGSTPLFKAVGRNFGDWAQQLYGHRIFEYFRRNSGFAGFAPWFAAKESSLIWNQYIYPSFLSKNELFPRNFFAGNKTNWNCMIVNDGDKSFEDVELEWFLFSNENKHLPLDSKKISSLNAHNRIYFDVELELPANLASGDYQLRLAVKKDDKIVGQNFYNIHVETPAILTQKIETNKKVYIFDTKAEKNLTVLKNILNGYGVTYEVVSKANNLPKNSVLIVPAETVETQEIDLAHDAELEKFIRERGGVLLVLEQKNLKSIFPGNQFLLQHSSTFVDMVSHTHPVFSGLDHWHFDTWNSPEHGFVINYSLIPYTINAVMVKGPTLSRTNIGSALVESTNGSGRMIISQLNATENREIDSVAAKYMYNLFAYALSNNYWKEARTPAFIKNNYEVIDKKLQTIDIAPYATTSFSDDIVADGKGGWTDQGKENDFSMVKSGNHNVSGVNFMILDPQKNNNRTCIVLRGTERPKLPRAVEGIKINKRLSRIFFLHTAGWGGGNLMAGAYKINYADKTSTYIRLQSNVNIGDWWAINRLAEAKVGLTVENKGGVTVGTFVTCWDNPNPEKDIASFDFLSESAFLGDEVDWMPDKTPVPILLAATGEGIDEKFLNILADSIFTTANGTKEYNSDIKAEISVARKDNNREISVLFPKSSGKDVPAVRIAFKTDQLGKSYDYLTCWIKSSNSGVVQFSLPCGNWKGGYNGELSLNGDNKWHKYRIRFNKDFKEWGKCSQSNLYGELFIFHRSRNDAPDAKRPEVKFLIKDICFE